MAIEKIPRAPSNEPPAVPWHLTGLGQRLRRHEENLSKMRGQVLALELGWSSIWDCPADYRFTDGDADCVRESIPGTGNS